MNRERKLIFDVGMHKGEDAHYYLKKGFQVVGFEANPDLVKHCSERFNEEIENGSLVIIEGAIVEPSEVKNSELKVKFYKNSISAWGTIVNEWAERNESLGSTNFEVIEVSKIDFGECLVKYGVPYYLKIDIEGLDIVCLKYLLDFEQRPKYISIESNKISFDKLNSEFSLFDKLGYDSFQIVNQSVITSQRQQNREGKNIEYKFQRGSSGLFGEDLRNEKWKSLSESLLQYKRIFRGYNVLGDSAWINRFYIGRAFTKLSSYLIGIPGWYDTHAKHSSVSKKE